jgi:succinoglycan biosynthesis transport protein ExoP
MELKQYIQIVQRWAWLLVLGAALGGVGGYVGSRMQAPVYQASTRLMVMSAPQEQAYYYDTYWRDQQLTQTYLELVTTQPVLDAAGEELGSAINNARIDVKQVRETPVIQLTVEEGNPRRAADIANILVEVLIEQNEAIQAGRYATTEESIQSQIAQVEEQLSSLQRQVDQISTQNFQDQLNEVEAQIQPLQEEVSTLQREIAALEPAITTERKAQVAEKQARIDQIQPLLSLYQQIYSNLVVLGKPVESDSNTNSHLAQLQSTLDLYQSLYLNLLSSLETVRLARLQNTPNIVQIEPATVPSGPIRPRPLMNTALAAIVGLMLAAGIVFLIEYLDDSLKTPEDVERILGLPVLGLVAEIQYKNKDKTGIYVAQNPRSPVSEAFRGLRTNLEFASVQKPIHTILVTSSGPEEGKSTVAVNLATILALSGKRVALVDADMRRPNIHRFLDLPNRMGLSNLFRTQSPVHSIGRTKLDLPQLLVITSGSPPPNPAELLGSERMSQILAELRDQVDVVVIDTPPSLVADAQILAGKVDAVLFVIQPGRTHAAMARASLEVFKRADARVIGTVLNRIPRNRGYYYGAYQYYSPSGESKGYYSPNEAEPEGSLAKQDGSGKTEPFPNYSFLNKVAKLSQAPDKIPPPDPPQM